MGLLKSKQGKPRSVKDALKLVPRDLTIIEALGRMGILTAEQIGTLAFGADRSTAIRRLTKLYRGRACDRLPRRSVADPYVYYLSRKTLGYRLLAERTPAAVSRPLRSTALLEHTLGVNELRVRVERACRDLGYQLTRWDDPATLQPLLAATGELVPDGYFTIQRPLGDAIKTSGFFVEYERTPRSSQVLRHKLARYSTLYRSGSYRELFGTRAMRVLVVYGAEFGGSTQKRIERGLALGEELGLSLVRFSALEAIVAFKPHALLRDPLWWKPGEPFPRALFEQSSSSEQDD